MKVDYNEIEKLKKFMLYIMDQMLAEGGDEDDIVDVLCESELCDAVKVKRLIAEGEQDEIDDIRIKEVSSR